MGVLMLSFRVARYGRGLHENRYPLRFIQYYVPAVGLSSLILIVSWWRVPVGEWVEGPGLCDTLPDHVLEPEVAMIRITRKVEFSATHFYYNPKFSRTKQARLRQM